MKSAFLLIIGGFALVAVGSLELGHHNHLSTMTGVLLIGMGNICMQISKLRDRL
jgi:hypothetical protein